MKHIFEVCAYRDWLCCVSIDSEVTCGIFAILTIVISFSGLTNLGIWHWAAYLMSILNYFTHFLAGLLLFLGALWGKESLKLAYCWICVFNILSDIAGVLMFAFLRHEIFIIWNKTCDSYTDIVGAASPIVCYIVLLIWDIVTPMVILGNLEDEDDVNDEDCWY